MWRSGDCGEPSRWGLDELTSGVTGRKWRARRLLRCDVSELWSSSDSVGYGGILAGIVAIPTKAKTLAV